MGFHIYVTIIFPVNIFGRSPSVSTMRILVYSPLCLILEASLWFSWTKNTEEQIYRCSTQNSQFTVTVQHLDTNSVDTFFSFSRITHSISLGVGAIVPLLLCIDFYLTLLFKWDFKMTLYCTDRMPKRFFCHIFVLSNVSSQEVASSVFQLCGFSILTQLLVLSYTTHKELICPCRDYCSTYAKCLWLSQSMPSSR